MWIGCVLYGWGINGGEKVQLRGVLVLDNFICEKILFGVRERKVQEKRGVWRF